MAVVAAPLAAESGRDEAIPSAEGPQQFAALATKRLELEREEERGSWCAERDRQEIDRA